MYFNILFIAFSGFIQSCSTMPKQSIDVNGLIVEWVDQGDSWKFSLEAPTDGWLAIGFNDQNNIVGTNLIMGAVVNGATLVEDQYVTGFGKHPPVESLGSTAVVTAISGTEKPGQTSIQFEMPHQAIDSMHFDLSPGRQIWLICAFSREDDFNHHSMMRKHVQIRL